MIDALDLTVTPATLASRWLRFAAFLIDQLIALAIALVSRVLAFSVVGALAYVGLMAFGIVQIILVSTRGQTVGKLIVKIAVVDRFDHTPPGFVRAGLIRQVPMMLVSLFFPSFALVYLLLDGAPMFLPDRRCIHDYLVGTIVVRAADQLAAPAS